MRPTINATLATLRTAYSVVVLLLALAGCGQRFVPAATDGGAGAPPQTDGQGRPDHLLPGSPAVPQCAVALKLDACCASPMPVTRTALAQDPCLVPYPYHASPPPGCKPPPSCAELVCDWREPLTRLARGLPDGTCTWKSECAVDADCTMALAWSICGCGCVQGVPRELLDPGLCLTEPQAAPPAGAGCSPICDDSQLPCSAHCLAPTWIQAFCEPSKAANGAYQICNLAGNK